MRIQQLLISAVISITIWVCLSCGKTDPKKSKDKNTLRKDGYWWPNDRTLTEEENAKLDDATFKTMKNKLLANETLSTKEMHQLWVSVLRDNPSLNDSNTKELLSKLINAGVHPDTEVAYQEYQWTAAYFTVQNFKPQTLEMLIAKGADINRGTRTGNTYYRTPLYEAFEKMGSVTNPYDYKRIAEILIQSKVINIHAGVSKRHNGEEQAVNIKNPLVKLVEETKNGALEIVRLLVQKGADFESKVSIGDRNMSVKEYASQQGFKQLTEYFEQVSAKRK